MAVQLVLTYIECYSLLNRGIVSFTWYTGTIAGFGLVVPQGWWAVQLRLTYIITGCPLLIRGIVSFTWTVVHRGHCWVQPCSTLWGRLGAGCDLVVPQGWGEEQYS